MFRKSFFIIPCLLLLSLGLVRPASAQWAVIDVGAIAQLIEQYLTLQEQLQTARDHLQQARQQYESLTGDRGMQRLLAGINRNYLPEQWNGVEDALYGRSVGFAEITRLSDKAFKANAVLTPQQVALFSARDQIHIDE